MMTTTRFDKAVELVLQKEGGFQKHKNDTGNYNSIGQLVGTNWGIAAMTYERYLKQIPTEQDMREMRLETAKDIYHALYWLPIRADQIKSEALAITLFDWHVNAGNTAVRYLQRLVGATPDGKVGPRTIEAVNKYLDVNGEAATVKLYTEYRERFYRDLVTRRPRNRVFLAGWLNRTRKVYEYVKRFIHTILAL